MVETSQRYPTSQRLLLAVLWFELLALTVKLTLGWQTNALALLLIGSRGYGGFTLIGGALQSFAAAPHLQ